MPLTAKGREILAAMRKQYGKEQGERVFYASKNKGTISGVDTADADEQPVPQRRISEIENIVSRASELEATTPAAAPPLAGPAPSFLPERVVTTNRPYPEVPGEVRQYPPRLTVQPVVTRTTTDARLRAMNETNRAFWRGRR